jgi:hypothetical protein
MRTWHARIPKKDEIKNHILLVVGYQIAEDLLH